MAVSNMSGCSMSNSESPSPTIGTRADRDLFALPGQTFVLVHGAFHGGWCWRAVARLLRETGHSVFTPTLTGLGERRHLMSSALTIDTFVDDVTNLIETEDLTDVILVGHSFGGTVISGVADRMPERIRRLVYLDAITPLAGKSVFEMMPEADRNARLAALAGLPDGDVRAPHPPARHFGVHDAAQAAWVDRRLTPHPTGAYTSPVMLRNPITNGVPAAYIRCTSPAFPSNDPCAAFAQSQISWQYREIATGHNAMISAPLELTDLLLDLETSS